MVSYIIKVTTDYYFFPPSKCNLKDHSPNIDLPFLRLPLDTSRSFIKP